MPNTPLLDIVQKSLQKLWLFCQGNSSFNWPELEDYTQFLPLFFQSQEQESQQEGVELVRKALIHNPSGMLLSITFLCSHAKNIPQDIWHKPDEMNLSLLHHLLNAMFIVNKRFANRLHINKSDYNSLQAVFPGPTNNLTLNVALLLKECTELLFYGSREFYGFHTTFFKENPLWARKLFQYLLQHYWVDITEEQLIKLFRNKPDSELMSSNSSLIKFIKAFAYYNYPRYIQWLHNKCKQNEITQLFSQLNKQEKETILATALSRSGKKASGSQREQTSDQHYEYVIIQLLEQFSRDELNINNAISVCDDILHPYYQHTFKYNTGTQKLRASSAKESPFVALAKIIGKNQLNHACWFHSGTKEANKLISLFEHSPKKRLVIILAAYNYQKYNSQQSILCQLLDSWNDIRSFVALKEYETPDQELSAFIRQYLEHKNPTPAYEAQQTNQQNLIAPVLAPFSYLNSDFLPYDAMDNFYSLEIFDAEGRLPEHLLLDEEKQAIPLLPQYEFIPAPQEEFVQSTPKQLIQGTMDEFIDQLFTQTEADLIPLATTHTHTEALADQFVMQVDEPVFNNSLVIRAGIQDKYLGANLPSLTIAKSSTIMQPTLGTISVPFERLSSLNPRNPLKHTQMINALGLYADLYTAEEQPVTPEAKVTFICAGRKENAFLPPIAPGERVILVLTENEFATLGVLPAYDVLVIKEIHSSGQALPPGTITSRRLAIILFAAHNKLSHVLMLDDNIKVVNYTTFRADYSLFDYLYDKQNEALCISISTGFNTNLKSGQLGSKLFMLNLAKIKEYLPDEQLYLLLPEPKHNSSWGEDYYLQIMLHHLAQPQLNGYAIAPPQEANLLRSKTHRNAFRATNKLAEPLESLSEEYALALEKAQLDLANKTIASFNDLIRSNQLRYQAQQTRLANADLVQYHAQLNGMEVNSQLTTIHLPENPYPFQQRWQQIHGKAPFDASYLRSYQQQAIIAALTMNTPQSQLMMATGTGKTRVQIELARLAYHAALDDECIIIVTPFIQLMEQFYDNFIAYNKQSSSSAFNLQIPQENIIKISSALNSCTVAHLQYNQRIKQQKCILIFCEDSFSLLMKQNPELVSRCCLLLLDEYHEYAQRIPELINQLNQWESELLLIGSTATPPLKNALPSIFNYTFKQGISDGILAPVIADSLGLPYTKNNLSILMKKLPQLLQQIIHPGFRQKTTLQQSRGVIYFASIEECDAAKEQLKTHGYNAYAIHSGNSRYKEELESFINSNQPGVLLAVNMLGIGFDDPSLSWLILAVERQHDNIQRLEQMVGRVVRKYQDKIGYILGFGRIICEAITPLLKDVIIDAATIQPEYYNQDIELSPKYHFTTKTPPNSKKRASPISLKGLNSSKLPRLSAQDLAPHNPILIDIPDEPQETGSKTSDKPNVLAYPSHLEPEHIDHSTHELANTTSEESNLARPTFGRKYPRFLSFFAINQIDEDTKEYAIAQPDSSEQYRPA
ncbi:DEAD/DEAH box helicase family protein [Legionella lytica]|uniref:DEAD/DEAH box helicase family protein n=1 Tax=Legionella lytica TaxID=96232 RepID=A0ABY4YAP7_9GAMM|nr:DEAD/DEAH box helicase family protein [Legionella lytica]USQ14711.1 DEAD/DEAH box helicase family protein [Legionella lytica]